MGTDLGSNPLFSREAGHHISENRLGPRAVIVMASSGSLLLATCNPKHDFGPCLLCWRIFLIRLQVRGPRSCAFESPGFRRGIKREQT